MEEALVRAALPPFCFTRSLKARDSVLKCKTVTTDELKSELKITQITQICPDLKNRHVASINPNRLNDA